MEQSAPLLFALEASRRYGERVASRLEWPLSAHEERSFEDGEHKIRPVVERTIWLAVQNRGTLGKNRGKLCARNSRPRPDDRHQGAEAALSAAIGEITRPDIAAGSFGSTQPD